MSAIKPRETVIARRPCGSCGKPVNIVTNKNGLAYYYCGWATEAGTPCNHHERFGRSATDKMMADFDDRQIGDDQGDRQQKQKTEAGGYGLFD